MDFENVLYTQSYEEILDKEKGAKERIYVVVTREENCFLVWRKSITWTYRGDEDAPTEYNVIKWFKKGEKNEAIEYAVDWIRKQSQGVES